MKCDIKMDVLKEGYKIVSIKDLIGFECTNDENPDKLIECVMVALCTCPKCDYHGLVDMGEAWLSKKEIKEAISKRIIFSDNPEINVLFRLLS
jgi:hypothetical protein